MEKIKSFKSGAQKRKEKRKQELKEAAKDPKQLKLSFGGPKVDSQQNTVSPILHFKSTYFSSNTRSFIKKF